MGKDLRHAEMRLMLTKMIWSFDLELHVRSEKWMNEWKVHDVEEGRVCCAGEKIREGLDR